uniref:CBS domain-containing protein n=1 Tax=Strongyloides stercoralis TaxID=6248 RepID=A0A0K0ELQ7_STRER
MCKLFSDDVLDNHLARILISNLRVKEVVTKSGMVLSAVKKKCLIPIVDCQMIVCDVIKEIGSDELPKT